MKIMKIDNPNIYSTELFVTYWNAIETKILLQKT